MQTGSINLVVDSRDALVAVRRSLIELYGSVGADPAAPQEVARQFGINRNLTWKLSRVINAADPFAVLNHLPGQQGVELAVVAFARAGAPDEAVDQVRRSMAHLNTVMEDHAGGRERLELVLESMGLYGPEVTESGRELAFRGNSMVWGVQARTRAVLTFLAPSLTHANQLDCVMIAGLVGFQRLRENARWRISRSQMHTDKGKELSQPGFEELEPKAEGDTPQILREFCSPTMPPIEVEDGPEGRDFYLPGGEVGRRSAFDCFFGYLYRGLPVLRGPDDEFGSTAASITLPAETLLFDLIVHKDINVKGLEALLYGFPHGGQEGPSAQTIKNRLPLSEKPVELPGSPPAVSTPAVPQLARITDRVYQRLNWVRTDFKGYRLIMKHPPMNSRVVLRWPLI